MEIKGYEYEDISAEVKKILGEDNPASDSPYWALMSYILKVKSTAYIQGVQDMFKEVSLTLTKARHTTAC